MMASRMVLPQVVAEIGSTILKVGVPPRLLPRKSRPGVVDSDDDDGELPASVEESTNNGAERVAAKGRRRD